MSLLAIASDMIQSLFMAHLCAVSSTNEGHWGYAFLAEAPVRIANAAQETLLVGFFDARHNLLRIDALGSASATAIQVPVREIAANAIRLDAHSLVLAHNHPSGDANPSQSDISATQNIVRTFRPLEIHVDDHIIVSGTQLFSFRDAGML